MCPDLASPSSAPLTERIQHLEAENARLRALLEDRKRGPAPADVPGALTLEDIFLQAPVSIAVLSGPEHVFTLANPLYLRLVGNRPTIGLSVRKALPEIEGQGFFELLDEVYTTGNPFVGLEAAAQLDRDGDGEMDEAFFNFVYQPLRNADGEVEGIMVLASEVTEQVRARQKLEAVFESLTEGLLVANREGQITDINKAALQMLGFDTAEDARRTLAEYPDLFDVRAPEGTPVPLEEWPIMRALRGERFFESELTVRRRDAARASILSHAGTPVYDGTGALNFALVTLRDITTIREAEQAVRESEARFRVLAEAMPQMVWATDAQGLVDYFNPRWYEYTGQRPGEGVGDAWVSVLHPDDHARTLQRWSESVQTGTPYEIEYQMRRHDGTYRWQLGRGLPQRDADGTILRWIGTCTDIHDQKQAEAALAEAKMTLEERVAERTAALTDANTQLQAEIGERRRAEQALEESNRVLQQRNRELEDFAYIASHDLQEPLRKIRAFADLLHREHGERLDEEGRHFLERVQDAAGRMSRLISDLLSYSRVATRGQDFHQISLNTVLQEVRNSLEFRLEEVGGRIEADALPRLEADPSQMQQLFQNLLSNALKFHREDVPPCITITATHHPAEDDLKPAYYTLTVQDNGIGFDEKYADQIFSPFERLHQREQYEGTGIGLAICRRIVERHHGTIRARSAPNEGATFIITLPERQPK